MRLQGAAAAELCYVAAGRFEARIEGLLGPWDIAAGSIILMNAGGKVTDYSGGGDFYSGREVLATNGKLHDEFLKVLGKNKYFAFSSSLQIYFVSLSSEHMNIM